jgi:hypothetical protein
VEFCLRTHQPVEVQYLKMLCHKKVMTLNLIPQKNMLIHKKMLCHKKNVMPQKSDDTK